MPTSTQRSLPEAGTACRYPRRRTPGRHGRPGADGTGEAAEAARALRPGGQLVLSSLARHDHRAAVEAFGHANLGFTTKELKRFVEKAGLEVLSAGTVTRERRPPHFEVISLIGRKQ